MTLDTPAGDVAGSCHDGIAANGAPNIRQIKDVMAANSTTRRGAGAGHGGPARHGVSNSETRQPGPGRGITGRSVAELMAAQGARELAAEQWLAILSDPAHPKHAEMVAKAAERMDGAPMQRQEISGGGAPVRIERVIIDHKES